MLKKVFLHFWSLRREFIRYFVIGTSGVVLDIGTLYLLKEYVHLRPVVAVVLNQIFLVNYAFFLNKLWAFKAKGVTHRQMIKFFILAGFNYLFSVGWMWFFNEVRHFNYLLVRIIGIILSVGWNFLLYKHWVYKH